MYKINKLEVVSGALVDHVPSVQPVESIASEYETLTEAKEALHSLVDQYPDSELEYHRGLSFAVMFKLPVEMANQRYQANHVRITVTFFITG